MFFYAIIILKLFAKIYFLGVIKLRIGLAETDIYWEDKQLNRLNCVLMIEKAVTEKVDLILFPEMSLTGFSMNIENTAERNNETFSWFQEMVNRYKINVGFGWVKNDDNNICNMYSIITEDINNNISYSKIHLFSMGNENEYFQAGENIYLLNVKEFTVCPFICYDLRFPEIFQIASSGCSLITIAANWPETRKQHWTTLLRARAIENQCFVAGINRKGSGQGIFYSGDSCIYNPLGEKVPCESFSIYNNLLLIADIDLNNVLSLRKNFNVKSDRKPELYVSLINSSVF